MNILIIAIIWEENQISIIIIKKNNKLHNSKYICNYNYIKRQFVINHNYTVGIINYIIVNVPAIAIA